MAFEWVNVSKNLKKKKNKLWQISANEAIFSKNVKNKVKIFRNFDSFRKILPKTGVIVYKRLLFLLKIGNVWVYFLILSGTLLLKPNLSTPLDWKIVFEINVFNLIRTIQPFLKQSAFHFANSY